MFAGDSLSVILFLASCSVAGLMGGVAANDGAAKKTLYVLGAVFGLATVLWIAAPSANPASEFIKPFVVALWRSGGLVIILSVGYVLLTVRGVTANGASLVETEHNAPFAAPAHEIGKWKPDIKLGDAVVYMGRDSRWAQARTNVAVDGIRRELLVALDDGKIRAWAKTHPDDEDRWQVARELWRLALQLHFNFEMCFSGSRLMRSSPA